MDKKPHVYWDSDVAKWVEGACYILAKKTVKSYNLSNYQKLGGVPHDHNCNPESGHR